MHELLPVINDVLGKGESAVVATIITSEGSTPRTAGSKMLIRADGSIAGTVGGGLYEGQIIAAAPEVLASGSQRLLAYDMAGQAKDGADLICGGAIRVLLERVDPDPETAGLFRELSARLDAGQDCLLLTRVTAGSDAPAERCLLFSGDLAGRGPDRRTQDKARRLGGEITAPVILEGDGRQYCLEPILALDRLVVFGGGHVSLPTTRIASMAGFRVTVLDDRPEFANPERFPWAAKTIRSQDFESVCGRLALNGRDSVVIVTRGHRHDKDALAAALRTGAGYIGMIGSVTKRDSVYERLRNEGFTPEDLARVHSPIGLPIGGETPAEIAVSIVAELIAARSARRAGKTRDVLAGLAWPPGQLTGTR